MIDTPSYHLEKTINTPEDFWTLADNIQNEALNYCDNLFLSLREAPLNELQNFLIQYRYFTAYYISDLALLIARLNEGVMKSFLSEILHDELGCGDHEKSHPRLYDNFLISIEVPEEKLNKNALKSNIEILDKSRKKLIDIKKSTSYGIGLRGMGGECVCQVYIEKLYANLIENPYIKSQKDKIDWLFWEIHIGEHDIAHREKTRSLIDSEIVKNGGEELINLAEGYLYSVSQWKLFWMNIYSTKESIKNIKMYKESNSLVDFSIL